METTGAVTRAEAGVDRLEGRLAVDVLAHGLRPSDR
jgi:hypothetical protein